MKLIFVPIITGPMVPVVATGATFGAHAALLIAVLVVFLAAGIIVVDAARWVVAPRSAPTQVRLLEVA